MYHKLLPHKAIPSKEDEMLTVKTQGPIDVEVLNKMGQQGNRLYTATRESNDTEEIVYYFLPKNVSGGTFIYMPYTTYISSGQIPVGNMIDEGWNIATLLGLKDERIIVYWMACKK